MLANALGGLWLELHCALSCNVAANQICVNLVVLNKVLSRMKGEDTGSAIHY
jgi:hypothetical protein